MPKVSASPTRSKQVLTPPRLPSLQEAEAAEAARKKESAEAEAAKAKLKKEQDEAEAARAVAKKVEAEQARQRV